MDEPCSALDPIATSKVEELIQQLKGKYTIVVVTHNMQRRAGDRTHGVLLPRELIEFARTEKSSQTLARQQRTTLPGGSVDRAARSFRT